MSIRDTDFPATDDDRRGSETTGSDTRGGSARRRASGPRIVTHFIAGYPNWDASLDVARGLIDGGAFALEMQIPFSDPSADGPVIEAACREALAAGFCVDDAWKLLRAIRAVSDIPAFVMSYASLVVRPGVAEFVRQAREAGATGLIIPDLVPGADEGLFELAANAGCPAVPVMVPWISDQRLDAILAEPIDWVYLALRSGITGSYTELGDKQSAFLAKIKERGKMSRTAGVRNTGNAPRVMAGFGIQDAAQVRTVVAAADAAIVGSALVRGISEAWAAGVRGDGIRERVKVLVETLRAG